jgi:hypothetical protein
LENFNENFINSSKPGRSIKTWNACCRLQAGCCLTSNSAEGWNRFLNSAFREPHPSLLQLLKFLLSVQQKNEVSLDNIISFTITKRSESRHYEKKMLIIKNICEHRFELDPISFLRAITINYAWKLD